MTTRVVFAGTPGFSVPCLEAICQAADFEVVGVVSQPDRRSGRGMRLTPSPVKQAALQAGIEVITPDRLRNNDDALQWLQEKRADLLVVVAFGMILPPAWLNAVTIAAVNVHASLLPRWRGAAPIERCLLAGDARTGVVIMQMEEGLDTGGIYACRELTITDQMTGSDLWFELSGMGAALLIETLPKIVAGLKAVPQSAEGITYADKIKSHERNIDWQRTAAEIERQVRCFSPKPGARTRFRGKWLKVLAGEVGSLHPDRCPGTVLATERGLTIACGGSTSYTITTLQPEGKRAMAAADFVRGISLDAGERLDDESA